jgi:cytochrome b561
MASASPTRAGVLRYHPVLVLLHWGLAVFIVAAIALGTLKMATMANTDPMKPEALRAHMIGGLLILALMSLRLIVRLSTLSPPSAATGSAILDRIARFSHAAFYVLVVAMALSGLIMGVQTGVIRIIAGGHPPIPSDFWAFPIRNVHYLISRLLIALIVLHLTGVLFHTFLLKDRLLRRMGFGNRFASPGSSLESPSMTSVTRKRPIFARLVLLFQSVVLTLIASRVFLDPIGASAKDQIALGSPLAIVVAQIGLGAFPLAAAIFLLVCALSGRTLRSGLVFMLILDLTALLVRALGVLIHGGFADHRGPFIGESVFAALALTALLLGNRELTRLENCPAVTGLRH